MAKPAQIPNEMVKFSDRFTDLDFSHESFAFLDAIEDIQYTEDLEFATKALNARFDAFRSGQYESRYASAVPEYHDHIHKTGSFQAAPTAVSADRERQHRCNKACTLFEMGCFSRANNLLNSFGVAPASEQTQREIKAVILDPKEGQVVEVQDDIARLKAGLQPKRLVVKQRMLRHAFHQLVRYYGAACSGHRNEFWIALLYLSKEDLMHIGPFFEMLVNNDIDIEFLHFMPLVLPEEESKWS